MHSAAVESQFNVTVPLKFGQGLVFNSLSERVVLLDETEFAWFKDEQARRQPGAFDEEPLARRLAAMGFFVNPARNELNEIVRRYEAKRTNDRHLAITIATTLACNLACGYCFQGQNKPSKKLEPEAAEAIIKLVDERAPGLDSLSLTWYGGEPLMNQAQIWALSDAINERCKRNGVRTTAGIVTNGYLLTKEVAQSLLAHGVRVAQVTVDGTEQSHNRMRPHISGKGSYSRILDNITSVVFETDLVVSLRVSVDAANGEEIFNLLHELSERGFGGRDNFSVYFAPIEAISEGCSDYEEMTLSKKVYADLEVELLRVAIGLDLCKHRNFGQDLSLCQAVRHHDMVIAPNGDLHKCWDTVSFSDMRVSSLSEGRFEALNDGGWTNWSGAQHEVCKSCKILPICGGGCAFKAVHPDQQSGSATLPCISLKFNLAERVFEVAVAAGVVGREMWDPEVSPTSSGGTLKTGRSHLDALRELTEV